MHLLLPRPANYVQLYECFDVIATCNKSVIFYAFILEYFIAHLSRKKYLCVVNIPKHRWENIKLILKKQDGRVYTSVIWLRIGTNSYECGNEPYIP